MQGSKQRLQKERAFIAIDRSVLKPTLLAGLLMLGSTLTGCEGTGTVSVPWFPTPEVKSVAFYPEYFCSGDEITVTWDTEDVDRMEILTIGGRVILSTTSPSGTATTSDIEEDDLPLRAIGYAGDQSRERLVDGLVNIDEPIWTASIPSTSEIAVPDSVREEEAYPEQIELDNGTVVSYMVYKVYVTYSGLYWRSGQGGTLPSLSQRARIDKIRNETDQRLHFSSYVAGAVTLMANAEGDLDPDWPSSIAHFSGDYDTPVEQHVATQYGEQTKPPDEWFRFDRIYDEAVGNVRLYLYCENP